MKKFKIGLLITAMLFTAMIANAQDAEQKETAAPVPQSISTLNLAAELAKYGYKNNSALALLQAAELYLSVKADKLEPESVEKGKGDETQKKDVFSSDPKKLLADAKEKAKDDPNLLAMIEKASSKPGSGTRGAVGGASSRTDVVSAKSTDIYKFKFYGGELAAVLVSGDGDTDLDLYIYDSNGNFIVSDADYSDDCVCTWYPRYTGSFTIKIVNRGSVYNRYVIATN